MTTTIDKTKATQVAQEMKEAINAILAKHGLQVSATKMGYGEWYEYKVTAVAIAEGPNGVNLATKEAQYYEKFGWQVYGQAPNFEVTELKAPLGTGFTHGGKKYAFAGVAPQRKKYPIVAINLATKEQVFFPEAVVPIINAFAK